jgi:cytochrome c
MRLPVAVGALAAAAAGASAFAQGISDPGERAFQYCFSCHSVEQNQTETLTGPNLNGVVGRPIASLAGFSYTQAMKDFG